MMCAAKLSVHQRLTSPDFHEQTRQVEAVMPAASVNVLLNLPENDLFRALSLLHL
jgi:hypothetical protein